MDTNKSAMNKNITTDELANLTKISDVDNYISTLDENLVISTANETHVKEIAELWANLASIQQLNAPERYDFKCEKKDWHEFVLHKLFKKHNLLLVAHNKDEYEVKGFLYLQTITLPSSEFILKGVIEDIYTKPQYRREGIASKLLDVAMKWAQTQNIKQVDLISITKAKDLLEFYLKYIKKTKTEINFDLVTF